MFDMLPTVPPEGASVEAPFPTPNLTIAMSHEQYVSQWVKLAVVPLRVSLMQRCNGGIPMRYDGLNVHFTQCLPYCSLDVAIVKLGVGRE
jgi:hypothetical protein